MSNHAIGRKRKPDTSLGADAAKKEKLGPVELPETLILSVTVHGVIDAKPLKGEEQIEAVGEQQPERVPKLQVPDGMRVLKISAVAPGVCNVVSPDDTVAANKVLNDAFGSNPMSYDAIRPLVPGVVAALKTIEAEGEKELREDKELMHDEQIRQFVRSTPKGYEVKEYGPKETMINKMYTRSIGEGADDPAEYKITIMNSVEKYDLFSLILTGRLGAAATRASEKVEDLYGLELAELLEFVQKRGVKNVVLFDFSCSEMPDIDDRTKRLYAREVKREGLTGGKRTRRRNRKTKTRRGKKRLSWRR